MDRQKRCSEPSPEWRLPARHKGTGKLNTATLTLFLALHPAVAPTQPLLIIDDPVQSMEEAHIAQSAAPLRTLKGAERQVALAVHERALFGCLTANGFYMRFIGWCENAGIPQGRSLHGLRKGGSEAVGWGGVYGSPDRGHHRPQVTF